MTNVLEDVALGVRTSLRAEHVREELKILSDDADMPAATMPAGVIFSMNDPKGEAHELPVWVIRDRSRRGNSAMRFRQLVQEGLP